MTNSSAARTNLTFKEININTKEKVGEGCFRECYEGIYIGGHRNQQDAACKRFKTSFMNSGNDNNVVVVEKEYFQMSSTQQAIAMAESWNETCDKNKKIILAQGSVYVSPQDGLTYLIEPLIRECTKFNSNSGWIASNTEKEWQVRCMEAFTHFSYHQSGGQLLVCDLQGRYRKDKFKKAKCRFELCSDSAICSRQCTFGPTDLGEKGIHAFFANHTCNEFCQATWSRPKTFKTIASEWFPSTSGTAMISSKVAANPSVLTVKNPANFRMGSNGLLEVAEEEEKENNNKFATVANNNNKNNNNKRASKNMSNNKKNSTTAKAFSNVEVVGDHQVDEVIGEMGGSGSDWSSVAGDVSNSGSDWSDDSSADDKGGNNNNNHDRYDNNADKGYEEFEDDEVAGDTASNDNNFNKNNSYDIYGDDYGSEYGDATGDTTDDFFIGHGIGTDDEKIVGEQSGDDSSDFPDEGNDQDNEGENAIIFC